MRTKRKIEGKEARGREREWVSMVEIVDLLL